jgi:hypothetical protein
MRTRQVVRSPGAALVAPAIGFTVKVAAALVLWACATHRRRG